jgi:hypothetical protein
MVRIRDAYRLGWTTDVTGIVWADIGTRTEGVPVAVMVAADAELDDAESDSTVDDAEAGAKVEGVVLVVDVEVEDAVVNVVVDVEAEGVVVVADVDDDDGVKVEVKDEDVAEDDDEHGNVVRGGVMGTSSACFFSSKTGLVEFSPIERNIVRMTRLPVAMTVASEITEEITES